MEDKALRRAFDNAINQLWETVHRITDAAEYRRSNPRKGDSATWEDVRVIQTAEYLLSEIRTYIDYGNATDPIIIEWEESDNEDA